MPMENAQRIVDFNIKYDNLTQEEQEMYQQALLAFKRMKGHSMIGGTWIR
jgi:hypothetical protein